MPMNELDLIIAKTLDCFKQSENKYMVTNTGFYDPLYIGEIETYLSKNKINNKIFYGGYEAANRQMIIFYPDYIEEQSIWESQERPIKVLRVRTKRENKLTHRDYLGALMGMGVKREVIGDILVLPTGADIFIDKTLSEFFSLNFDQVGKYSLKKEIIDIDEDFQARQRTEEFSDTVASIRLDNIVSSAFKISRKDAQNAIKQKIVFINNKVEDRQDYSVKTGDKLVLRGKGKLIFRNVEGNTKKGRLRIKGERFL